MNKVILWNIKEKRCIKTLAPSKEDYVVVKVKFLPGNNYVYMISQSPKGIQYQRSTKERHLISRFENNEQINNQNTVLIEFFNVKNGIKIKDFYESGFLFDKTNGVKSAYKYIAAACSTNPPKLYVILAQNNYTWISHDWNNEGQFLKISLDEKTQLIKVENIIQATTDSLNIKYLIKNHYYFDVSHNGENFVTGSSKFSTIFVLDSNLNYVKQLNFDNDKHNKKPSVISSINFEYLHTHKLLRLNVCLTKGLLYHYTLGKLQCSSKGLDYEF